jgi:hypothetical protein
MRGLCFALGEGIFVGYGTTFCASTCLLAMSFGGSLSSVFFEILVVKVEYLRTHRVGALGSACYFIIPFLQLLDGMPKGEYEALNRPQQRVIVG